VTPATTSSSTATVSSTSSTTCSGPNGSTSSPVRNSRVRLMKQVRSPTTSSMPNSVKVLTMTWLVA
jgi:hypothetical protein